MNAMLQEKAEWRYHHFVFNSLLNGFTQVGFFSHQFYAGGNLKGFQGCHEILINPACLTEHQSEQ